MDEICNKCGQNIHKTEFDELKESMSEEAFYTGNTALKKAIGYSRDIEDLKSCVNQAYGVGFESFYKKYKFILKEIDISFTINFDNTFLVFNIPVIIYYTKIGENNYLSRIEINDYDLYISRFCPDKSDFVDAESAFYNALPISIETTIVMLYPEKETKKSYISYIIENRIKDVIDELFIHIG